MPSSTPRCSSYWKGSLHVTLDYSCQLYFFYAVIVGLIEFALHLVQIPNLAIGKSLPHHKRAFSMLYGQCDTGVCSSFTNTSQHIESPTWLRDFKLWFVSPKDFISLFYCQVFVCLCSLEPFHILLLFLDSNSIIKASFTESSLYSGCRHIFFTTLVQMGNDVWSSQLSITQAGDWWNCPLHR